MVIFNSYFDITRGYLRPYQVEACVRIGKPDLLNTKLRPTMGYGGCHDLLGGVFHDLGIASGLQ